jgi:hypothetical protein
MLVNLNKTEWITISSCSIKQRIKTINDSDQNKLKYAQINLNLDECVSGILSALTKCALYFYTLAFSPCHFLHPQNPLDLMDSSRKGPFANASNSENLNKIFLPLSLSKFQQRHLDLKLNPHTDVASVLLLCYLCWPT